MNQSKLKRSSHNKQTSNQGDWGPFSPGVGARHSAPPTAGQGGGYQAIYPLLNFGGGLFCADHRISELKQMGLPAVWLSVARQIGFDAFMVAWTVLSADEKIKNDRNRVVVPCTSNFLRYQRDPLKRLPSVWLSVARQIGSDAFMIIWTNLSTDEKIKNDRNRVRVPEIGNFFRYQRNYLVRTLHARGLNSGQIKQALCSMMGERLHSAHIRKITNKNKGRQARGGE